jgi:hypothetical protein
MQALNSGINVLIRDKNAYDAAGQIKCLYEV